MPARSQGKKKKKEQNECKHGDGRAQLVKQDFQLLSLVFRRVPT